MRTITLALAGALALVTVDSKRAAAQQQDIVETAVAAGTFTTLAKALTAAGLVETLKGPGPFTVFAPNDEAFAKLPPGALDKLLADTAMLKQVLLYHVVAGRVMAADVAKMTSAKTVAGPSASIMVMSGGAPMIDNANVVRADIAASNGVIHVIDTVLMPKSPGGGGAVRKE